MADKEDRRDAASPPETAAHEKYGTFLLALGLLVFGFASSFIAGLSKGEGAGKELLSGLFAFAGGAILAFAGFRASLAKSGATVVRNTVVGLGLLTFSAGLIPGSMSGIATRISCSHYFREPSSKDESAAKKPSTDEKKTPPEQSQPSQIFSLESSVQETCATIKRNFDNHTYDGDEGAKLAREALRALSTSRTCAQ